MDPYKILNLTPDATPDEIRKAYRKAARKHHPDHGGEVWIFQQVQEAYESLTNPKAKKKKKTNPAAKPNNPATPSQAKPNARPKTNIFDSLDSFAAPDFSELDFSQVESGNFSNPFPNSFRRNASQRQHRR